MYFSFQLYEKGERNATHDNMQSALLHPKFNYMCNYSFPYFEKKDRKNYFINKGYFNVNGN